MKFTFHTRSSKPSGVVGKIFASLFFTAFFGMGMFFEVMIIRSVLSDWQARSWPTVECRIEHVEVVRQSGSSSQPYTVVVRYTYRHGNDEYKSDTLARSKPTFSDYDKAQALASQFAVGATVRGRVNPQNPSQCHLRDPHPASALVVLFPLIFVAVGAGGIWFTWRKTPEDKARAAGSIPSISQSAVQAQSNRLPFWFFGIFLLVGALGTWWLLIRPTVKVLDARSWPETPCRIIASEVRSHRGDDSTTYSVDILYEYEVNGQPHRSNRYHFLTGSSSGHEGKQKVVRQYPPGSVKVCYVNPRNTNEAVLNRGFSPMMLAGLIPLVFLGVGLAGILYLRRQQTVQSFPSQQTTGPIELKPQASPVASFVGMIFISLFWNGIVSVFLYQVWRGFQSGKPEWFLTVFMIPFVLVGLGLIGGIFYTFLGLFNPKVRMTISSGHVALGAPLDLQWQFDRSANVIERLHIWMEGREELSYKRGKNTHTEKETFAQLELLDTTRRTDVQAGKLQLIVPSDSMHSFENGSQKIAWTLHLRGHIKWRPDVKLEYPITVNPLP